SLAEAPSRIHVPHQPAKRWHRRERSKHRLEPLDATPKHRLVAVDGGLAEGLLDIDDRFAPPGIATAQQNAASPRPAVLRAARRARGNRRQSGPGPTVWGAGRPGAGWRQPPAARASSGVACRAPPRRRVPKASCPTRLVAAASTPAASCTILRMAPAPCGAC